MTVSAVLDSAGRRRSPATLPGFHGILYQIGEPDDKAATTPDRRAASQRIQAILQATGIEFAGPIDPGDLPPAVLAEIDPYVQEAQRLPTPPRAAPKELAEMVEACVASSLLGVEDGDTGPHVFVHRWTASELERSAHAEGRADETAAAHRRAADYWRWRVSVWPQDRRVNVHDLLEARYHHLAAGQLEQAGEVTEAACSLLHERGAWDDEAALIHDTLTRLPPNSDRKMSAWLGQLGNVAHARGDLPEAEGLYRRSLEINERLGNQAGMATTISQLGILKAQGGDIDGSVGLHGQALLIRIQVAPRDAAIDLECLLDHRESIGKNALVQALATALGRDAAATPAALVDEASQTDDAS